MGLHTKVDAVFGLDDVANYVNAILLDVDRHVKVAVGSLIEGGNAAIQELAAAAFMDMLSQLGL